jgi:hypothetical protein
MKSSDPDAAKHACFFRHARTVCPALPLVIARVFVLRIAMISIRHTSGPLAGQSQTFDDSKERIEVGRDPDECDIVYPADTMSVGHRHCALIREVSGDWALHLYGDHFVGIDKMSAQTDAPIKSGQVLHLGPADGPSFEVAIVRADNRSGKTTDPQPRPAPASVRLRRIAIGGGMIALALICTLGVFIGRDVVDQHRLAATFASISGDQKQEQVAIAEASQEAGKSISQSAIDRLARGTFLVYFQDAQGNQTPDGTAWVIGPNVLATNAHIAARCDQFTPENLELQKKNLAVCNDYPPGLKMFVRQPGPGGASFEVVKWAFHPGWVALPQLVLDQGPIITPASGSQMVSAPIPYDVGLLYVKGELPPGLALQVASKQELLSLKPGMPIASAGYPSEHIQNWAGLTVAAYPQVHFGNISRLTDYLDLPTDPAHNFLLLHTIPGAGGSSGSPIIGASGHIIALNNSGWSSEALPKGVRWARGAPSGALVNGAQRADLVVDLLAGRAQASFDADKPYWMRQIASFARGGDVIGAQIMDENRPNPKAVARLISETHGKLDEDDMHFLTDDKNATRKVRMKREKLGLSAGTSYFIFVYADSERPIDIYLKDGNDQTVARKANADWYPGFSFKPSTSGPWTLIVVGPDLNTSYTTRVYTWQSSAS